MFKPDNSILKKIQKLIRKIQDPICIKYLLKKIENFKFLSDKWMQIKEAKPGFIALATFTSDKMDVIKARKIALLLHRTSREQQSYVDRFFLSSLGYAVATLYKKRNAFSAICYLSKTIFWITNNEKKAKEYLYTISEELRIIKKSRSVK